MSLAVNQVNTVFKTVLYAYSFGNNILNKVTVVSISAYYCKVPSWLIDIVLLCIYKWSYGVLSELHCHNFFELKQVLSILSV